MRNVSNWQAQFLIAGHGFHTRGCREALIEIYYGAAMYEGDASTFREDASAG
jgi:hypothetical protein